jgi:hypothetical protein
VRDLQAASSRALVQAMIRSRPDERCRWLTFGLSERWTGVLGGMLDCCLLD